MKKTIDLRSDTVTQPTPEMRSAMANAVVGDDVYGEDPTINSLEEKAAGILSREAALFLPSGTMANQVAIHLHTSPGSEVIGETRSHVFNFEMGAMAALSGTLPRPVPSPSGILDPEALEKAIQPRVGYATPTSLILLENSHNLAGGRVTSLQRMRELTAIAHKHELPVHLDGARIFNAAAFLRVEASELAQGCETIMFCLSKGLAAPVGSMLVGDEEVIAEARRIRKLFGGGMRQAGILAAAGLVALDKMVPRVGEDNARAGRLAELIEDIPAIILDSREVETNILFFRLNEKVGMKAQELKDNLSKNGILVHALGGDSIRIVTYYSISDEDIEETAKILRRLLS